MFWSAVTLSLITSASSAGLPAGWEQELAPGSAQTLELERADVALVAEVTASRLFAVNATRAPQLLLFGSFTGGETRCIVPAHGTLDVRIPHAARGHFWVEFVSFERGLRRSGPLALDDLIGAPGDSLWVTGNQDELHVALAHGAGASFLSPTPDVSTALDRAGVQQPSNATAPQTLTAHVPGGDPGRQNDDTPPDIGDDPLPPF